MEKKFGFGCMRLPLLDNDNVDYDEFNKMIDYYMEQGFNYFDTAHGYVKQMSETALRDCLVARYPREAYVLTNKLSVHFFNSKEELQPLFDLQLKNTGVAYFDYYLMHAQDRQIYKHFEKCGAYEFAKELKEKGLIKHIGISFHDTADVLEEILITHPEIEVVQIQLNYVDYESPTVQSRKNYEVCVKYNKPVIIMEPVKGGGLVNLPQEGKDVFDALGQDLSYASYAIRFAASLEKVFKVLSGMSTFEQVVDNTSYMKDFQPLNRREYDAIKKVTEIFNNMGGIPCTACRYCTDGCPMNISIPDLFSAYNAKIQFNDWNSDYYYGVHTKTNGKASDCVGCKQCENICPQHLNITELLKSVANTFEK